MLHVTYHMKHNFMLHSCFREILTLSLSRITTKIVCYSLIWTSTVDRRTHRPTSKQQRTFANIRLWKHCFPAFHNFFKYGSKSSTGAKVKGHESCLWSERSTGAKVSWNESFWTLFPGSECSTERQFHGSKSSFYGLFAPGNESAEERKGQIPPQYCTH